MGDTGPCGPCSEIHVDSRSQEEKEKVPGYQLVNKDHPQVIEIWNLVFMQYNRKADGSLENLPMKVIDTGMGFERLVRTLQGKQSNYDSDVFQPMLQFIGQLCNCQYGKDEQMDVAMRVIADHIRTIAFAIADGQLPSNAKAGYVIRRILRRAVRYGYTFLQQREAFLYKLIPQLVDDMGEAYPEIKLQSTLITKVLKEEEEAFLRTLEKGIALLDKLMAQSTTKQISGVDVFTLYDTYGFPLDLTELILREKGFTCNEQEFHEQMQLQKERARNAAKQDVSDWVEVLDSETTFVGYDTLSCDTQIVRYRKVVQKNKSFYQVVLTQTPFYAEMGGEVGDSGWLGDCPVLDTKRENNLAVHILERMPDDVHATLLAKVDDGRRKAIAANHSATHILHYALRHVLGTHVEQKGSLVTADSLRFDFSHFQKVTPEELREVEKFANQMIRQNLTLDETRHATMQQAKEMGAMALFGEKYGDDVRVIKFGESVELCGGCHVQATGLIGSLRILMETSVAAGVRRIEAVTAQKVDELYYQQQDLLNQLRGMFNNAPDLINAIRKTMDENNQLKKQLELLMQEKAEILCKQMMSDANDRNGIRLVMLDGDIKVDMIRNVFTLLKSKVATIPFAVIGTTLAEDKPMISLFLSQPLLEKGLHAGNIIKSAAKHIQGGGGGQPWMATAGGRNAEGLVAAKEEMLQMLDAIQ
jgi:alanyl-tRNA synthetase